MTVQEFYEWCKAMDVIDYQMVIDIMTRHGREHPIGVGDLDYDSERKVYLEVIPFELKEGL